MWFWSSNNWPTEKKVQENVQGFSNYPDEKQRIPKIARISNDQAHILWDNRKFSVKFDDSWKCLWVVWLLPSSKFMYFFVLNSNLSLHDIIVSDKWASARWWHTRLSSFGPIECLNKIALTAEMTIYEWNIGPYTEKEKHEKRRAHHYQEIFSSINITTKAKCEMPRTTQFFCYYNHSAEERK